MKSPKLLEISIDGFLMVLSVPLNKTSSIGISERNATALKNAYNTLNKIFNEKYFL
jgi:hypothetical protein